METKWINKQKSKSCKQTQIYAEKAEIVCALWNKVLVDHIPEIDNMNYVVSESGYERVIVTYVNGAIKQINVTGDGLIAMLYDITQGLQ